MAQFEERLPRWAGAVAERDAERNTSSGAPAAMALASALEPPETTGAVGIPVAAVNPSRRAVVSVAYASAEYEIMGERTIAVTVDVEMDVVVVVEWLTVVEMVVVVTVVGEVLVIVVGSVVVTVVGVVVVVVMVVGTVEVLKISEVMVLFETVTTSYADRISTSATTTAAIATAVETPRFFVRFICVMQALA